VRFFLDNNLAPPLASALHELSSKDGYEVRHLRDLFEPSSPDTEWLPRLSEQGGWVLISGDYRISRNKHEREAWMRSGLTSFFLAKGWTNLRFWDQAWRLVRWWPRIIEQAHLVEPGAGFMVPLAGSGKFKQLPRV
jgi:hypothetical protein